jgi:hypothetical protein
MRRAETGVSRGSSNGTGTAIRVAQQQQNVKPQGKKLLQQPCAVALANNAELPLRLHPTPQMTSATHKGVGRLESCNRDAAYRVKGLFKFHIVDAAIMS